MKFPDSGKWWASRVENPVEPDGTVTVCLAVDRHAFDTPPPGRSFTDSPLWLRLTGTPETLRQVAYAIAAQVDGAEANTPEEIQR